MYGSINRNKNSFTHNVIGVRLSSLELTFVFKLKKTIIYPTVSTYKENNFLLPCGENEIRIKSEIKSQMEACRRWAKSTERKTSFFTISKTAFSPARKRYLGQKPRRKTKHYLRHYLRMKKYSINRPTVPHLETLLEVLVAYLLNLVRAGMPMSEVSISNSFGSC